MMNIKSIAVILVLTVITFFWVSSKDDEVFIAPRTSSRKLFLGPRKKSLTSLTVGQPLKNPDSCEVVNLQLGNIDFNIPVIDWVERLTLSDLEKCARSEFKDRVVSIKINCFEKLDEQICTQQAVFLRAILRVRGVTDAEDQDLLADLVISEFAGNTPDFHKLEKYSEKLMSIDPNQASYQKLWVSSKVISRMEDSKSPTDLADELAERVDGEVWNDPEMQGLKMAVSTGLLPDNVEEYARGYLTKKSDPRMHEVLGWALWRQNRYAEAVHELQKAIDLSPNDKWLKNQMDKVSSGDANTETYQARISLGINLQDLYN
jgi:tetratricopeptide (TPR) repeat protein